MRSAPAPAGWNGEGREGSIRREHNKLCDSENPHGLAETGQACTSSARRQTERFRPSSDGIPKALTIRLLSASTSLSPMNVLQNTLSSARLNRLLLLFSALVLAAGVVVLMTKIAGGSDKTSLAPDPGFRPTLPEKDTPLTNSQGVTIKRFEQLDPEVRSTIRTFLATAVSRKNLAQSWPVIAPSMKAGWSFSRWKNAKALPNIVPYPVADVDRVQYYLDYASTKEILAEVGLFAGPKANQRSTLFRIGLAPVGKGAQKRWLVDYWFPLWTPPVPIN